jgi:hypothetical protein
MLQRKALDTVQKLSGNLWTDFNEHDPGVTIMDAFNYALTELQFKSNFPFPDYLSSETAEFKAQAFGLYKPFEVLPSGPVTETDYRKLIFDQVQSVTDLWLIPLKDKAPGSFNILVDLNPSVSENEKGSIYMQIKQVCHRYRNLGENLGEILFITRDPLELKGEINLNEGADPSEVLAEIYFICAKYFIHGIQYSNLRELIGKGFDWTEIFDGPLLQNGIIENKSIKPLKTSYFISDLHFLIRKIEGVKTVNNLSLVFDNRVYTEVIETTNPLRSFTIKIPVKEQDIQLILNKNGRVASISLNSIFKFFKKYVAEQYGQQNQLHSLDRYFVAPKGRYQSSKNYYSIQNDLPDFYGINDKGIPSYFSDERKAKAKQLKAYLLIIDLLIANTSQNLDQLYRLLSISDDLPKEYFPNLEDSVSHWEELLNKKDPQKVMNGDAQFFVQSKHTVFDLLDSLYGEKSFLEFLNEFDEYNSDINRQYESLKQRAGFLRSVPQLAAEKALAVNLLDDDPDNCPGLKRWFSAILGLPNGLELPVTNMFSKFSLRLLSDKEFYEDSNGLLNIDLVVNELKENFKGENIFDVPEEEVEDPTLKYDELKKKVSLLNHNILFESFLRNGITLSNYKIIQTEKDVFMLVFHSKEQKEWMSVGRFDYLKEAIEVANQLRKFLIVLNRQSENMYIVEHILLGADQPQSGYILKLVDTKKKELFTLLNPVSRDEIYALHDKIKESLHDSELFEIRVSGNERYVIYYKVEETNVVYCNQDFSTREEAENYLQNLAKNNETKVKLFYQHSYGVLFPPDFMDFGITIILPAWSARFYNKKFRDWCEELLEERRPAHLKLNFKWLEAPAIRTFEKLYFAWREAYANSKKTTEPAVALATFLAENVL